MQFVNNDPLYKLSRITGPHHNLLGLKLAPGPMERAPDIEVLDRDVRQPVRLDGRQVAEQVMRGVQDASLELGRKYYIEKIQYLASDTPPAETYRQLANELVRMIDSIRSQP